MNRARTVAATLAELLAEVLRLETRTHGVARLPGVVARRVVVPEHNMIERLCSTRKGQRLNRLQCAALLTYT